MLASQLDDVAFRSCRHQLAADNDGYMNLLYPSPDGKWISYDSEGSVKTRPEGSIWEVNLADLLRRQ